MYITASCALATARSKPTTFRARVQAAVRAPSLRSSTTRGRSQEITSTRAVYFTATWQRVSATWNIRRYSQRQAARSMTKDQSTAWAPQLWRPGRAPDGRAPLCLSEPETQQLNPNRNQAARYRAAFLLPRHR